MGILIALLIVWAALVVLGIVVIKGLFWLIIVGAVLFVATGVIGFMKGKALGGRRLGHSRYGVLVGLPDGGMMR